MKILVIQLARLGDIFSTWPVLRALRRHYPEAELHLLVRKKFADACAGLDWIEKVHLLNTEEILNPMLNEDCDAEASAGRLSAFFENLALENFDQAINLSFSPTSSYLTHLLERRGSTAKGYTRFLDGALNTGGEVGTYFFAQVGLHKSNRIHTVQLMAGVADVSLSENDWTAPEVPEFTELESPYVAVHVGASLENKSYAAESWALALSRLLGRWDGKIYLLGSAAEVEKADEILRLMNTNRASSLVGKTRVADLFSIIGGASLLIGCDSSPIHIASLTKTLTLNLSFSSVNFWETGPKSAGSRILWSSRPEDLHPEIVSEEAFFLLAGFPSANCVAEVVHSCQAYQVLTDLLPSFRWNLIQYIYFGAPWPRSQGMEIEEGVNRLSEINQLALEQIETLKVNPQSPTAPLILDRADEMFSAVGQIVPDLLPLMGWYQAEKSRVPPADFSTVIAHTSAVHQAFARLLSGAHQPERDLSP
jgi:heptosyltransferase III